MFSVAFRAMFFLGGLLHEKVRKKISGGYQGRVSSRGSLGIFAGPKNTLCARICLQKNIYHCGVRQGL